MYTRTPNRTKRRQAFYVSVLRARVGRHESRRYEKTVFSRVEEVVRYVEFILVF